VIYDNPFEVRWGGSDAGSGVDYYNIFVSVNGGEDSLWIAAAADSAAMFTGETGRTYRFYSVAADHAGNRESAPAEPDAETTLTVGTRNPSGTAGSELVLYPNPADGRLIALYTGSGEGYLTLADVGGRVVRRVHFYGGGKQEITTGSLSNGFYIWTWTPLRAAPLQSGKLLILHE